MPAERRIEVFARRIVAQALNCVVRRFEDGSRDAQADARILSPDGVAGMESSPTTTRPTEPVERLETR